MQSQSSLRQNRSIASLFVLAAVFTAGCVDTNHGDGHTTNDTSNLGARGDSDDVPVSGEPGAVRTTDGEEGEGADLTADGGVTPSNDADAGPGFPVIPTCPPTSDDCTTNDPGPTPAVSTGSGMDSDLDGLSDDAETNGALGVDLKAFGADPYRKDVFIYIDYYEKPSQSAIDMVVQAFANAPEPQNPDGSTGITLHPIWAERAIDPIDQVKNMTQVCPDEENPNQEFDWTEANNIKVLYFPDTWWRIAHHVLFADRIGGEVGISGCSRGIPGHDLVVSLGAAGEEGKVDMVQAGTLMHELGHNLGLMHNGNEDGNYTPNYISVMNYNYQFTGVPTETGAFVLDYSRLELVAVSEQALDEREGIALAAPIREPWIVDARTQRAAIFQTLVGEERTPRLAKGVVSGWLDFNGNGIEEGAIPPIDLDGNGRTDDEFPPTQDDWVNLDYWSTEEGGGIIGDAAVPGTKARYIVAPGSMPRELPFDGRHP